MPAKFSLQAGWPVCFEKIYLMANTIGEMLRKTREAQNLSLEQVFQAIHIRPRFLEALENDRRDLLPSAVHGRGFLGNYVDFLGLPVKPFLDAWEDKTLLINETPEQSPEAPIVQEVNPASVGDPDVDVGTETKVTAPFEDRVPIAHVLETVSQTSAEIFVDIGKKLRRQREVLGLSLQDIELHLIIKSRYLKALEEGLVEDLPSLTQGRGMLANYSRFLELDSELLLLRFAEALQTRRVERLPVSPSKLIGPGRPGQDRSVSSRPNALKRFMTADLMIGSLVILVFFGFAVWSALQVMAIQKQEKQTAPLSIAQVLLTTPTETLMADTEIPIGAMNTPAEDEKTAAPEEASNVDEPTPVPTLDNLPLQVYVVALQRSWVRITIDGKVAFDDRIQPGNAYPFSGKDSITLETGNAAGLQVFFNQKSFGILGITGQVARLVFSKSGVTTPTPSFSPTPTLTQLPTITLNPTATKKPPTVTPYAP
jgi:cytoskeleton protein RodZ